MMMLCLLPVFVLGLHVFGVNVFSGGTLSSSGYFWPILIGALVVGHIWVFHSSKRHGGYKENHGQQHSMTNQETDEAAIVSRDGLHWHPELAIYLKGVKQEIPHIGLSNMSPGGAHALMMRLRHGMHGGANEQGIIHLKFQGLVHRQDITLGRLFQRWGKDLRSFGANLTMTVNGKENTEFENYVMQDKDKIELRYD